MYEYRHLTPKQKAELVKQRLARGFPPHEPPHLILDQEFYLLTVACYEHRYHLKQEERRQQILNLLFEAFIQKGLQIQAWVILPNHYHLLVKINHQDLEAENSNSILTSNSNIFGELGQIFRTVHGRTACQWNQEDQARGRKVWYRYSDRAIRSERHYYTTLNYIHYNPVKHGWTQLPYNWTHSRVHWYLEYYGRQWLRDCWVEFPVLDYGRGWDEHDAI